MQIILSYPVILFICKLLGRSPDTHFLEIPLNKESRVRHFIWRSMFFPTGVMFPNFRIIFIAPGKFSVQNEISIKFAWTKQHPGFTFEWCSTRKNITKFQNVSKSLKLPHRIIGLSNFVIIADVLLTYILVSQFAFIYNISSKHIWCFLSLLALQTIYSLSRKRDKKGNDLFGIPYMAGGFPQY